MSLSLSAPLHSEQIRCLPCLSVGSVRAGILPKSLPPCAYSWTSAMTSPLLSSTFSTCQPANRPSTAATAICPSSRPDLGFKYPGSAVRHSIRSNYDDPILWIVWTIKEGLEHTIPESMTLLPINSETGASLDLQVRFHFGEVRYAAREMNSGSLLNCSTLRKPTNVAKRNVMSLFDSAITCRT